MHEEQEKIEQYAFKVLFFLAKTDDNKVSFRSDELFQELEIPREYHDYVLDEIYHNSYIKAVSHIRYAEIKINEKGRQKAEELAEAMFQIKGINPLAKTINMSLDDTCELIFQQHKQNNNSLTWTKETFKPNIPRNLSDAKDILFHQKIIIRSSSPVRTILNPDILNCSSYLEAVKKIKDNNNPIHSNQININGDVAGSVQAGSGNQLLDFRENSPAFTPIQKDTTDAKPTNQTDGLLTKLWKLISENKLISTIVSALILMLIYYFIFGKWPTKI